MNIDNIKIQNIIFSQEFFIPQINYFSIVERRRLVEVISDALAKIPEFQLGQQTQEAWLALASPVLISEYSGAKDFFGVKDFMKLFPVRRFLTEIINPTSDFNSYLEQIDNSVDRFANIVKMQPTELLEVKNFETIKYRLYYLIDGDERQEALRYIEFLDKSLSKLDSKDAAEKERIKIFNFWLLRLQVFAFSRLKISEKSLLIKEKIGPILSYGFDLKTEIYNFLKSYNFSSARKEIAKNFLNSLEESKNILGNEQKFTGSQKFVPIIQNWLLEYNSILNSRSQNLKINAGTFHIVKFIDTNPWVKFLNGSEKDVLREVLDLYNWLLEPEESIKENSYEYEEKFVLPDNLNPNESAVSVKNLLTKNSIKAADEPLQIKKAGLDLGGLGTKPLPPLIPKPKVDIDKKLEDLRKKVTK